VRVKQVANGRDAVTSLARATFDGVICALRLNDLRAQQFVRMIRSGVVGYQHTQVIVIVDEIELHTLAHVKATANTFYLKLSRPSESAEQIHTILTSNPKPRVLLIEDDHTYADHFAKLLAPYYQIEIRSDGYSGMEAWKTRRHDVVLLDLMLPGLSGEEVQRLMLSIYPEQPIVILTANDGTEKHQSMVLAGAAAFLSKGVEPRAAAHVIDAVLTDRKCDHLSADATATQDKYQQLAWRVHAAHYSLSRGQTSSAYRHLEQALNICPVRGPSDDEWSALLSEF